MATPRSATRQGVSKFGPPLQLTGETSKAKNAAVNDFAVRDPTKRLTQEDQDQADERKQREAVRDLVQTWLDRLQLISVITTFFASTEAGLLGMAIPSPTSHLSKTGQVANIGLMSALVVHAHAAVISFLGAFFLIRYKLAVAQKEEEIAEKELVDSPTSVSNDPEKTRDLRTFPYANGLKTDAVNGRIRVNSPFSGDPIIWSTDPHLVQVGPFQRRPPTELLARCHSLCILLAIIGFLLALIGVISFAWDRLPRSASIVSSIAMGFCSVAGVLILIFPSTKTSHIYYKHKSH